MPDIDLAVTLRFIFVSAPFWLTILLISVFFHTWLNYKRREFIREKGNVLLEIRLPKDIQKTPAAMEMALEGMWEDVPGTNPDVYLKGAVRNWFSLEIVSIGGGGKIFFLTRADGGNKIFFSGGGKIEESFWRVDSPPSTRGLKSGRGISTPGY